MEQSKNSLPVLGALIAIGLAASGWFIGSSIIGMKKADQFVTVRGLNEREVQADLATWNLKFRAAGDELNATYDSVENQKETLLAFLKEKGISKDALTFMPLKVTDRQSQDYSSNPSATRYVLQGGLTIRTNDVERMFELSQKTQELVKAGVTLSDDNYCGNMPSFIFTKLTEVKPEMLKEATQNAREAAQQFAADSGARVGSIRRASQGYFSISGRDTDSETGGGSGECTDNSSIMKKLRVVTTIDYFLVD